MGTRVKFIEDHIKNKLRSKHLVIVLNKCDLVPTWVTANWVKTLSAEFPTLAFHASMTNPFGKGSLIQLLRQFAALHPGNQQISVGFIGYPNSGKSSIINTLRKKKVCKVAPVPGETKVWQYITLMKRIYLIDCPGIVYSSDDTESDIVLKGVVRIENLIDAWQYIPAILSRVKPLYLQRMYDINSWESAEDFLTQLARKKGKLLKKGEPDLNAVAKGVITDWQRGRLPYFALPPNMPALPEHALDGSSSHTTSISVSVPEIRVEENGDKTTFQSESGKSELEEGEEVSLNVQDPKDIKIVQRFDKIGVAGGFFDDADTQCPTGELNIPTDAVDWDDVFKSVEGTTEEKAPEGLIHEHSEMPEEDEEEEEVDEIDYDEEEEEEEEEDDENEKENEEEEDENEDEEQDEEEGEEEDDVQIVSELQNSSKEQRQQQKKEKKRNEKKAKVLSADGTPSTSEQPKKKRRRAGRAVREKRERTLARDAEARKTTNKGKVGFMFYDKVNSKNKPNWSKKDGAKKKKRGGKTKLNKKHQV
eukprot:TRINITY_DN1730_c0_g1_i3.p1 TRINITY_DN1730_c0_g1~~TRINITY_DN1730_c0_g1_i3.p1  ORF type:complete len:533 (+),score=241.52 TRINITY_DN1730_c0_g1_i3:617-2215(+)